jgi:drug/metabolite transporter (DMT)-like permease
MSEGALALILASAFAHASWNFLAKKASGGPTFVWLFTSVAALIEAPIALGIVLIARPSIGWLGIAFMAGTGVLHAAYFLSLQRGYEVGDLSLVYPLARGMGPLFAAGAAIVLFDERPSGLAIAGVLLVAVGR